MEMRSRRWCRRQEDPDRPRNGAFGERLAEPRFITWQSVRLGCPWAACLTLLARVALGERPDILCGMITTKPQSGGEPVEPSGACPAA